MHEAGSVFAAKCDVLRGTEWLALGSRRSVGTFCPDGQVCLCKHGLPATVDPDDPVAKLKAKSDARYRCRRCCEAADPTPEDDLRPASTYSHLWGGGGGD